MRAFFAILAGIVLAPLGLAVLYPLAVLVSLPFGLSTFHEGVLALLGYIVAVALGVRRAVRDEPLTCPVMGPKDREP